MFAVIYVEERTKRMHRVTRSRHGISTSLGIPVRQALEAADPDSFFREQMYDLWHRGATKLGWPTPPERMPGQEANA